MEKKRQARVILLDGLGGQVNTTVCNTSHPMTVENLTKICPDCGDRFIDTEDHPTHPYGRCGKSRFRLWTGKDVAIDQKAIYIKVEQTDCGGAVNVVAVDPKTGWPLSSGYLANFSEGCVTVYGGVNPAIPIDREGKSSRMRVKTY